MSFLSKKKSRSALTFLLSLMVAVSIAVCHCPPDFSSENHQHAQAVQDKHCHAEKSQHQNDDAKHEHSGHACLCSNDSVNGYLNQAETAPLKTDFLVAVLNQFQRSSVIGQPAFELLRSTHSPPSISQPLYITHLTLLIWNNLLRLLFARVGMDVFPCPLWRLLCCHAVKVLLG